MIELKSDAEIKIMQQCGQKLMTAVEKLMPQIKPGITTNYIDREAKRLIEAEGAESSFDKVPGYRWTTCLPINEQVVHTPPSERKLVDGDVLTVDIGAYYKGFHTDYATTIIVGGSKDDKKNKFLKTGKDVLESAIKKAVYNAYIGEISKTIQDGIYGAGYYILKDLTGHGVGRELHEDPLIPGFLERPVEKTYRIKAGLVIAIEVIYSMGSEKIKYDGDDNWSISSSDNSLSACFEKSVAITEENAFILT